MRKKKKGRETLQKEKRKNRNDPCCSSELETGLEHMRSGTFSGSKSCLFCKMGKSCKCACGMRVVPSSEHGDSPPPPCYSPSGSAAVCLQCRLSCRVLCYNFTLHWLFSFGVCWAPSPAGNSLTCRSAFQIEAWQPAGKSTQSGCTDRIMLELIKETYFLTPLRKLAGIFL